MYDNLRISYTFRYKNKSEQELDLQIMESLTLVRMDSKKDRFPFQLSGGEKQRVALAQTLLMHNHLLLMDEPFASLDSFTRHDMNEMVLSVMEKKKMGALLVTHSIDEAILLSHKIIILTGRPSTVVTSFTITLSPHERRESVCSAFIGYKKQIVEILQLTQ